MSLPNGKHGERLEEIRAIANHSPNQRPPGYSPVSIQALVDVLAALEAAEADARQKEAVVEAARQFVEREEGHQARLGESWYRLTDSLAALTKSSQ